MGHYKSNLRDIEFNLFEVLGRGDVLGSGPYEEVDADTAREMLKEVARLAEHELAESFQDADRQPARLRPADAGRDDARVVRGVLRRLPRQRLLGHRPARGARGHRGTTEPALGGQRDAPAPTRPSRCSRPPTASPRCSTSSARLEQKKLARWIAEKGWHSHDGAHRAGRQPTAPGGAKAVQNDDGTRPSPGSTSGSSRAPSPDWSTTSCTFVLARPEGAGPGTKGLSLFILPKFAVDLETVSWASATASTSPTSRRRWG